MAKAQVIITGDSKDAQQAMNQLEKKSTSLKNKLKTVAMLATAGLAAGFAAATTAIVTSTKATMDYADEIDKTSQRMGLARETTQEWKYIAEQMGTELSSLERGLTRFQKRVGEADDGLASAQRHFDALNVEIYDAQGNLRDMDDLFPEVIKKLSDMEDETKRNALVMELFGRGGKELIPILNAGSENIEELTQKAHELGIVMSDESIDAGVKLQDTLHSLQSAFGGLVREIAMELMPHIQDFANYMVDNMPVIREVVGGSIGIVIGVIKALGQLVADVVGIIRAKWNLLTAVTKQLAIDFQLAFEYIKLAVISAVNIILERLGVLENLPFGLGEKFKGLKDNIAESVEGSKEKIKELSEASKENQKKVGRAAAELGDSYLTLGSNIVESIGNIGNAIKNLIIDTGAALAEHTATVKEETEEQAGAIEEAGERVAGSLQKPFLDLTNTVSGVKSALQGLGLTMGAVSGPVNDKITKAIALMNRELANAERQYAAFGDEIDLNAQKMVIYKNTIEQLIADGIDLNNERLQELIAEYQKYKKAVEDANKETFNLNEVLDNHQKQLELAKKKNEVLGDSFNFAEEKAGILRKTIITLLENGIKPTNPELKKLKEELDKVTESMKDNEEQARYSTNAIDVFKGMVIDYTKELAENTKEASRRAADAIVDFVDSVSSGRKTVKEALKDMLISIITMLEKQVIANMIAAEAIAWAQSIWTFGVSLIRLAQVMAKILPALAMFEALKAGIRGLAEGGTLLSSGAVLVGERGPEILNLPKGARVTPLDKVPQGHQITFNFNNVTISKDYDIDYIGNQIVRKLKMAGVVVG